MLGALLKEQNYQLDINIKESLLMAFVDTVRSYHNALEENSEIAIKINVPGHVGGTTLGLQYALGRGFNENSWSIVINRIKKSFDMVSSVEIQQGRKREMIQIQALTFDLNEIIKRSVDRISQWSTLSKKFAQNLSSQIDTYIQKYPEEFQIPLSFRFTGMTMTLDEANEEDRRLYSIFHTPTAAAGYVFESKVYAAAFKLFKFLGYNEPEDMKKPLGVSR